MGVERFGLFVEFLPGRQGLLHVSELDSGESLEGFSVGQKVDVVLSAVRRSCSLANVDAT